MNENENENNFESLRRLLAQKRHELPPPEYFNSFSGQIIARIRAGEPRVPISAPTPWFLKFLQAFELKPAFAGAFASALSLLLIFGIIYTDRPYSSTQPIFQTSGQLPSSFAAVSPGALAQPSLGNDFTTSNSAAATSLQPVASLFGSQSEVFARPVSFSSPGN